MYREQAYGSTMVWYFMAKNTVFQLQHLEKNLYKMMTLQTSK